jgi:hypothetical protein
MSVAWIDSPDRNISFISRTDLANRPPGPAH